MFHRRGKIYLLFISASCLCKLCHTVSGCNQLLLILHPFRSLIPFQAFAQKRVLFQGLKQFFSLPAVQWRCRATCLTCSRPSSPPCSPAQRGFQWRRRGQVKSCRFEPTSVFLDFGNLFCMLAFSCCCLDSDAHLFLSTLFRLFFFLLLFFSPPCPSFSSDCLDPFTSAEAGDDSMPNLNPFLSKLVVDATHLPVVSSDGVSFSSRTSGHEMFGGNNSFFLFLLKSLVALVHLSVAA